MTIRSIILKAFGPGECVTNEQLCTRTGRTLKNVSAWVAYLRHRGELKRCTPAGMVPVAHMMPSPEAQTTDAMVAQAVATQPKSVFDTRVSDRLGYEPFFYCERN